MQEDKTLRLLVDRTAGRLARWLRILGLDVDYVSTCSTSAIARIARQAQRQVITRNRNLASRLTGSCILLTSEVLCEQLRQVVREIGAERCDPFSRCNLCNAELVVVSKQDVKGRVPDYVYTNHDNFSVCPACGRYYWQGTHWQRMQDEIKGLMEAQDNGSETGQE